MRATDQFQKFVGDFGSYSWVVLFAEAPIDSVTQAYAKITARKPSTDIAVTTDGVPTYAPSGYVVQVRDSDWVVIFHLVGGWEKFSTAGLAKRLSARVVEFSAEDTSGAVDCTLHEPDKKAVRYQTSRNATAEDELYDEMGDYAEEAGIAINRPPAAKKVKSYASLFKSLGIRPIEICLNQERTVIVNAADRDRIVRVDSIPA